MVEDAKELVIGTVAACMHAVFKAISEEDFRAEADALMRKWVNEHGTFGQDGIVEALEWWQDQATETNAFPLTRN